METLIEWHRIGDDLREQSIVPRLEFAQFTLVFNEMVGRTRNPAEARREQKLDKILQLIEEGDLNAIRVKIMEESKTSYKVFVSGAYLDNMERRKVVQDAITMAGMVWHGMEIFTASTSATKDECIGSIPKK